MTCTGGERGDILNPSFDLGARDIATVRRDEMARAAQILGVQHAWLGFEDSGFPDQGTTSRCLTAVSQPCRWRSRWCRSWSRSARFART